MTVHVCDICGDQIRDIKRIGMKREGGIADQMELCAKCEATFVKLLPESWRALASRSLITVVLS